MDGKEAGVSLFDRNNTQNSFTSRHLIIKTSTFFNSRPGTSQNMERMIMNTIVNHWRNIGEAKDVLLK